MTYPGEPPGQPYPPQGQYPPQQSWPGQYYGQAPPYGQQYPPPSGYVPPPRRRRRVGRTILIVWSSIVGLVIVLGIIGAVAGSTGKKGVASSQTQAAAAAPADTITYVVTGTTSADITYGPSGSNLSGSVPMRVTKKLGHAEYYAIQAQLNGDGKVTVEILVDGKVISSGRASGAYNIANAEIDQDPFTGKWENAQ